MGFGPDEGLWVMVVLLDVAVNGGLEIDDGVKHATLEALAGERGEEAFHGVQPGGGGWREMEDPTGMALQPGQDLRVLVVA